MAKKIQDGNQIVTNVDSNDNLTFSIKSSFIDSTPTANSTNLVTSGGVKSALDINTTDIAAAVIRIVNNETNISNNTTNIGTLSNLTTTSKTNLVSAINELETDKLETSAIVNEASTEIDEVYSSDYLNDKLVSVGTTAPTDGRRVFFAHSKNVLKHSAYDRTLNGVTLKVNEDKSITLTGTASANTNFNIGTNSTIKLKAGTYTFTKGATNVQLLIYYSSASVLGNLPIGTSSQTITINSDTIYNNYRVVISIPNGTQTNETIYPMLRLSTTSNTYEPYVEPSINVDNEGFISMGDLVSVGANQPSDGKRVWFSKSKNLLPYTGFITQTINGITITNNNNGTFTINGTATGDISYPVYDTFIPMSGTWRLVGCPSGGSSTTYMLSAYVGYWGGGSPNIDTGNGTNITYTGNVKVRFYIKSGTTCNNLVFKPMLTTNTSATYETFEPYVDQGIYVDNELYGDNYSYNEQVIGKWIDGKKLYRKVVDIGTLPNATTKHVAHNISNIGSVVTLRGIVTDYRFFPVPFAATSNAFAISIFADTTNIDVMAGNDRSNMTGFVIIEYTKTTD